MGRRKIEIQPITHERNRSVTFLKRKNGLFKKAYELGVLCSVDVAVIIFEERAGHEVKFHSYSSCDLRDIVQRQTRFQGDRELRGPADFAGTGGAKYDDEVDDLDDDDDESNRRSNKRKASMMAMGPPDGHDYLPPVPRNGLPHLPTLPMGGSGGPQGRYDDPSASSIGSLMPVSNDRVSNLRSSTRGSKRARTSDSGLSRSNSPSLDHDRSYVLPNSAHISGGRMSTRSVRHDQPGQSPMIMQHAPHLYPGGASSGAYGSPQQYGQLFPLGGPGGPMNMGPPPSPVPPLPPRFEPQYDPALYQHQFSPNLLRQAAAHAPDDRNDGGNVSEHRDGQPLNGAPRERGGGEMFAAFLEADERSRQMATAAAAVQRQHQDRLNWPASTQSTSAPSTPATVHPSQPGATTTATPAPTNPSHWFAMFSGPGPATNPAAAEGANMPWSSIGADIARILDANASTKPSTSIQQAEGSVVTTSRPGSAGSKGNGDSANDKRIVTPVAQTVVKAEVDGEEEKDAEGEEVDGGGDKKGAKPTTDDAMAVDAPQSSAKVDPDKGGGEEKHGEEVGLEDGDDVTVKTKTKPGRGRPKKAAGSSRGKGKTKV